jgi:hypothetical protein
MFALEGDNMKLFMADLSTWLRPKTLVITIRYTDWWNWESNMPLKISSKWMKDIKVPRSMEHLVVEFETRNGKKAELDALVTKQISNWRFEVEEKLVEGSEGEMVPDGEKEFLVLGDGKPAVSTWVGSALVGGVKHVHHAQKANGTEGLGEDEMLYYVVKMVWSRERVAARRGW